MDILHRVRGARIAEVVLTLPPCARATGNYMSTTYDVPELGRVIFVFRRCLDRQGKSSFWFWAVQNAILEEDLLSFDGEAR